MRYQQDATLPEAPPRLLDSRPVQKPERSFRGPGAWVCLREVRGRGTCSEADPAPAADRSSAPRPWAALFHRHGARPSRSRAACSALDFLCETIYNDAAGPSTELVAARLAALMRYNGRTMLRL